MKVTHIVNTLASFALLLAFALPVQAQMSGKEKRELKREKEYYEKDRKETSKEVSKLLKKKADKNARKESKRMKKQGYVVFPGSIPLDRQLEYSWRKQIEEDERGLLKYIFADGNGVGKTQTAAEMQAMEAAKLQLAGQISNEVNQIIEGKIANDQIDRETGNSLTKFVAGSKNYIIQNLSYVKPAMKVYREVGKQDLEVAVKLFYNIEEAMIAAEQALEAKIRADLEDEADELIEELDEIFDNKKKKKRSRR